MTFRFTPCRELLDGETAPEGFSGIVTAGENDLLFDVQSQFFSDRRELVAKYRVGAGLKAVEKDEALKAKATEGEETPAVEEGSPREEEENGPNLSALLVADPDLDERVDEFRFAIIKASARFERHRASVAIKGIDGDLGLINPALEGQQWPFMDWDAPEHTLKQRYRLLCFIDRHDEQRLFDWTEAHLVAKKDLSEDERGN